MIVAAHASAETAPIDRTLFLHAGLPKTATTLLQNRYFPRHEQIAYLGKYPKVKPRFCHPEVEAFVVETLRQKVFNCDVDAARRLFESRIQPLMGQGKAVVLSMEDGTHGSPRRRRAKMKNLHAVYPDCRLLITIRNPLDFVQSMYLQTLKTRNWWPRRRFDPPWLLEFDNWLDDRWSRPEKGELTYLDYAGYIADWRSVFGQNSVGILLFEQLKRQPQDFLDQLASELGVRKIDAGPVVEGPPVNPSWTPEQIERLRGIKKSKLRSFQFQVASPINRRRMLGTPQGAGARLPLPSSWQDRICQLTQAGNQALASELNLPLAEYGYPV